MVAAFILTSILTDFASNDTGCHLVLGESVINWKELSISVENRLNPYRVILRTDGRRRTADLC